MKALYISQSFIKEIFDYLNGEACGLQIQAKYIDGKFDLFKPSQAMKLGIWFEYNCTGALPKSGNIPEPDYTIKGELTSPYKRLLPHIENFKKSLLYYGIEILKTGHTIHFETLNGVIDILCKAKKNIVGHDNQIAVKKGQEFIIDLKLSGFLDNKWADYGWNLDMLQYKTKIILQPIHYLYIYKQKYGEDIPFLFFLFSSQDSNDYRLINMILDDSVIEQYEKDLYEKYIPTIKKCIQDGLRPIQTTKRCAECPLKQNCDFFMSVPVCKNFYLGSVT